MPKKKKIPEKITAEWLKAHGACIWGVEDFQAVFPRGAKINARNVAKAQREGLDLDWLVIELFGRNTMDRAYAIADDVLYSVLNTPGKTIEDAYEAHDEEFNKQLKALLKKLCA